jgi:hypothetical protein
MTVLITIAVPDDRAQLIQSRYELGDYADFEMTPAVDYRYEHTSFRGRLVGLNLVEETPTS